jgi:hypothetical protein
MNSIKIPARNSSILPVAKNILLMVILLLVSIIADATELEASMKISPDKCIVMSQGQSCYVVVELNWHIASSGDYCLYLVGEQKPLTCWSNSDKGEFSKAFTSKDNLVFSLQRENEAVSLLTAMVKIAWVHKKKGQPRKSWRLF